MSSGAQARAFTWLHLAVGLLAVVVLIAGEVRTAILLLALSAAIHIAALVLCRCPTCRKPPHWRGSLEHWTDWLRPWVRLWPEEVCSRCRTNLLAV